MTHAIPIPPEPYLNIPAAAYMRPEEMATYETIYDFPYPLQAMDTIVVYIAANGDVTHLNGPNAGREGVTLDKTIQGDVHLPFEQVVTESAYQFGATIERVNYLARKINLRVLIGREGMNTITYRACEGRWWDGQDEQKGGFLGIFTRFTGWRWIQVWPAKTVDTAQQMDPVAYKNNMAKWDINWIAPVPYFTNGASLMSGKWLAAKAGAPDKDGFYHGTLQLPNMGDIGTYVEYLLTDCAGTVWLQDNSLASRMVPVTDLNKKDGQVTVFTDPIDKTLVSEHDPHDNDFYRMVRATGLLNFMLSPSQAKSGEALWLRQNDVRFTAAIAPNSVVHLHVKSNNPDAQIVARAQQRFKRSR